MTDRMAALTVLVNRFARRAETGAALAAFEQRFRDDPLVLDKWFALQATAPGPAALPAVKALMGHSGFSLANPNRVRALIGTYFTANQTGFHRRDGAGYALFGDAVLTLDRRNPQLAARLATALRSWRSLEPERQGKARDALAAIAAQQGLSTDVRDIVERTLG
jgi:aminopeptidase N